MAGRKEDVDLRLSLENPENARAYIDQFDWGLPEPPRYVVFGLDEKIWFANMTDEEAVRAALIILQDVEIPMAFNSKQLEFWEH